MHIKTIGVNYNYIVVNLNLSEQKKRLSIFNVKTVMKLKETAIL